MKNSIKKIIVLLFLISSPILSNNLVADEQPPHPGDSPVGQGNPVGNGAPIDGGLSIFITMSAIYGVKKINNSYKKQAEISQ
ncbi:MAG: hypothetical protein ACOYO1_10105 [Bacteroidales bacterium]